MFCRSPPPNPPCMHVCQWSVWEFKRKESRCKNMAGGRERECSQVQQPLVTGDGRVSSIPRFLPAKPPAGHYRSLPSSPAELIRLLPVPDSPFYSPSTHGGSRRSRFSDAAAPSSHRLQSSYHRIPWKGREQLGNNSLWTCSKPMCHHLVKSYQPHHTPLFLTVWISMSRSKHFQSWFTSWEMCSVDCRGPWKEGVWLRHVKFATHWCEPGGRKNVASSPLRFVCLNQNFSHPC